MIAVFIVSLEWNWRIFRSRNCFACFLQTAFAGRCFASLITVTLSADIWKTWLVEPTGISERLASYLLAFGMAVIFSLIFPESSQKASPGFSKK